MPARDPFAAAVPGVRGRADEDRPDAQRPSAAAQAVTAPLFAAVADGEFDGALAFLFEYARNIENFRPLVDRLLSDVTWQLASGQQRARLEEATAMMRLAGVYCGHLRRVVFHRPAGLVHLWARGDRWARGVQSPGVGAAELACGLVVPAGELEVVSPGGWQRTGRPTRPGSRCAGCAEHADEFPETGADGRFMCGRPDLTMAMVAGASRRIAEELTERLQTRRQAVSGAQARALAAELWESRLVHKAAWLASRDEAHAVVRVLGDERAAAVGSDNGNGPLGESGWLGVLAGFAPSAWPADSEELVAALESPWERAERLRPALADGLEVALRAGG